MVIVEYTQPKLISASIYRDTGEFSCVITRHYVAANTVKLGSFPSQYRFLNLSCTQFGPTQTRNMVSIPLPAPIAEHIVCDKARNPQQNRCLSLGVMNPYLVGLLLQRLVDRPLFEPSLSKVVLPLITATYGPNGVISLTLTFNHILLYVVCKRR